MATITLDALPANTPPLTGPEVIPISNAGVTEKTTVTEIKNYVLGALSVLLSTTNAAITAAQVSANKVLGTEVAGLGNIAVALPQASTLTGQTITFARASALSITTDSYVLTAFAGDTIDTPSTSGGLTTVDTGVASYAIPRTFTLTSLGSKWIIK